MVSVTKFEMAIPEEEEKARDCEVNTSKAELQKLHRQHKTREAMALYREMLEKGVAPNAITYKIVFQGLCRAGGCIANDVEVGLDMMPSIAIDVTCETEGEEAIQEGDIVTMRAWIFLKCGNGFIATLPHASYFPFHNEGNYWLLLVGPVSNNVWVSQKVSFMDKVAIVTATSKSIQEFLEGFGASVKEINAVVNDAIEKVKSGSRLVMVKFQEPDKSTYNLTAYCLSDTWICCDKKVNIKLKVGKCSRVGLRAMIAEEGPV
eukprot:Gb_05606 [translate_table: standard]